MGGVQQSRHEESENSTRFKKCESDKKVQHGGTSVDADAGQLLVVCHQGDAVACQILLEQVDFIDGQRDDLAVHVGADKNHRAGQVVLAAHLQHLRRIVAEQQ